MTPKFSALALPGTDPSEERSGLRPRIERGHVAGFDEQGRPLVDFPANPFLRPVPARSCVDLAADAVGAEIVLWFEADDPARPLVIGCIRQPVPRRAAPETDVEIDADALFAHAPSDDITVKAVRTLTLRCGKASVTLTREGRVLVSGTYVETRAVGTNRIQGGAVRIN